MLEPVQIQFPPGTSAYDRVRAYLTTYPEMRCCDIDKLAGVSRGLANKLKIRWFGTTPDPVKSAAGKLGAASKARQRLAPALTPVVEPVPVATDSLDAFAPWSVEVVAPSPPIPPVSIATPVPPVGHAPMSADRPQPVSRPVRKPDPFTNSRDKGDRIVNRPQAEFRSLAAA